MTERVNGASYPGIWVERNTGFVKVTFSADIKAITSADLSLIGTPTAANPTNAVASGTIADSTFGVTESAISFVLRDLETRATVLGVSTYDVASKSIDVLLGHAEGWFAALNDGIVIVPPASPIIQLQDAKAVVITQAGTGTPAAPNPPVGTILSVDHASFPGITYTVRYVAFNGTMPVPVAPGQLALGPGGTSGATPPNSPTGTPGWYPATAPHAS